MMSPHSVARFLPADALEVDLVVFDEASQIRVAEAISALGRASREVINAMRYLAKVGLGISREELVRESAALFGV